MNHVRTILFIVASTALFLSIFFLRSRNVDFSNIIHTTEHSSAIARDVKIAVVSNEKISLRLEVADTSDTREKGLSYRKDIGEFDGMLFIFPELSYQTFWMKDMNFDLDMIWLDENGVVIQIDKNVKANGYNYLNPDLSEKISSHSEIKYVVELNSGKSDILNIEVGDQFTINY